MEDKPLRAVLNPENCFAPLQGHYRKIILELKSVAAISAAHAAQARNYRFGRC